MGAIHYKSIGIPIMVYTYGLPLWWFPLVGKAQAKYCDCSFSNYITLTIIFFSLYQCYFHFRFTFTLHDLLFIVGEPLVHYFADTGVQTLQLLVFWSHIRSHRLSGEETHQAGQQTVDATNDLRVWAGHACRNSTLEGLETG